MKIKSVSVIEDSSLGSGTPPVIHAFTADDKGRAQAKELFRKIALDQVGDVKGDGYQIGFFGIEDIDIALSNPSGNGIGIGHSEGKWTLMIVESIYP